MIKQILFVGLGGAFGSILRFLTSLLTAKYYSNTFPLATFITNVLGCFIIGILIGIFGQNIQSHSSLKLLLITGFCGGYTTFSTFAAENISLFNTNHYLIAFFYIATSIIIGLFALWFGFTISQ